MPYVCASAVESSAHKRTGNKRTRSTQQEGSTQQEHKGDRHEVQILKLHAHTLLLVDKRPVKHAQLVLAMKGTQRVAV
mgnify:CR=1 FL=1